MSFFAASLPLKRAILKIPRVPAYNPMVVIIGLLAAAIASAWSDRNDPTVTLKTKDWQCMKTEPRRYSYITMVGKVPITNHGTHDECMEWKRVAG